MLPKFAPNLPITTHDGLVEAMLDVARDENPEYPIVRAKWLQQRLPYGARVRHILREWVASGFVQRVAYGVYEMVE